MKKAQGLVAAVLVLMALLAAAATAPRAAAFSFRAYPYDVRDLPVHARPYSAVVTLPRTDTGVHDQHGVRMRRIKGVLYDFPRGQATFGLLNLASYRVTDDEFYLERALAQARRLHETHVAAGEAWYYPNRPSKNRHGINGESIRAPYYSALSQGRVLMFFSRLAEVTGEALWRDAADHTFRGFLRPGPRSGPYVVNVDSRGCLWLQEWPWPGMRPDDTFNGHNSAAFGIYEYWHLTRETEALRLFRGAATTAQVYAGTFRNTGWLSLYCHAHRVVANPFYHHFHVGQLLVLYRMTGSLRFARYADLFSADYPRPIERSSLVVRPGRYEAVQYASSGAVLARRTVTAKSLVRTQTNRRQRMVRGGDIQLRIAAGPWAGWWLPELPGKVYAETVAAVRGYDPVRSVRLLAGRRYRVVRLDERGRVGDVQVLRPEAPLSLPVSAGATVEGRPAVRLAEGELEKCWLLLGAGAKLR
jgi:hypothetical protein